jgi:hypothetical protein
MVMRPFCGSLVLALLSPWGGTTLGLPFRESLVLAPWGQTLGLGPFRGSLVLASWDQTLGLVPCVWTLVLGPCAENSSQKSICTFECGRWSLNIRVAYKNSILVLHIIQNLI